MEKLIYIASYIVNRYQKDFNAKIDEMKLHKLLYFAQRESFIQNDEPLFEEQFIGYKYGPVLLDIRYDYKNNNFVKDIPQDVIDRIKPVMDIVFKEYAKSSSWSLSLLTHGEYSWQQSRISLNESDNGNVKIENSNIIVDASRIRRRRKFIEDVNNYIYGNR